MEWQVALWTVSHAGALVTGRPFGPVTSPPLFPPQEIRRTAMAESTAIGATHFIAFPLPRSSSHSLKDIVPTPAIRDPLAGFVTWWTGYDEEDCDGARSNVRSAPVALSAVRPLSRKDGLRSMRPA